jgi:hypothetical protein
MNPSAVVDATDDFFPSGVRLDALSADVCTGRSNTGLEVLRSRMVSLVRCVTLFFVPEAEGDALVEVPVAIA